MSMGNDIQLTITARVSLVIISHERSITHCMKLQGMMQLTIMLERSPEIFIFYVTSKIFMSQLLHNIFRL